MTMPELTDVQIAELISIPKTVLNPNQKQKQQKSSLQVTYDLRETEGNREFKLYLRQNPRDPESFSCGLSYIAEAPDQSVTLCRYNGSNHVHYNPLEGDDPIVNRCHIHRATSRYMLANDKPDKFAETTDRYSDFDGALACILRDCNITGLAQPGDEPGPGEQIPLW